MGVVTHDILVSAIADASRGCFTDLFENHKEQFYYCCLVTTGEGHPPVASAWSYECLWRVASGDPGHLDAASIKWSYADSPYYCYGESHFFNVRKLFEERPRLNESMTQSEWDAELEFRLVAIEAALRQLDVEGVFGRGIARDELLLLAEIAPPDGSNVIRAKRLNAGPILGQWLREFGE